MSTYRAGNYTVFHILSRQVVG